MFWYDGQTTLQGKHAADFETINCLTLLEFKEPNIQLFVVKIWLERKGVEGVLRSVQSRGFCWYSANIDWSKFLTLSWRNVLHLAIGLFFNSSNLIRELQLDTASNILIVEAFDPLYRISPTLTWWTPRSISRIRRCHFACTSVNIQGAHYAPK